MDFIAIAAVIAIALLIWDCVEVGRNDATNLVNAVFGSRVLTRRLAVITAGVFVVLGATFASPVMDTMRSGIFNLPQLTPEMAISVFLSAYIVDTIFLYAFSAFGMPVSTTATLVFSLAGGAIGVTGGLSLIHWDKLGTIMGSIFGSIVLSGVLGFLLQRILRGAIGKKTSNHMVVMTHGPWIAGLMVTFLSWFMLVKGLKGIAAVKFIKATLFDTYGTPAVLIVYWAVLTFIAYLALTMLGKRGTKYLFHFTAVLGMICMAFAFGQNDLANCATPGLAAFLIWKHPGETAYAIPVLGLFLCGVLMFLGMSTENAQRVTRAEVNMASQQDHISLWAPEWCRRLARLFVKGTPPDEVLAPPPALDPKHKKIHFDPLRASVIMSVGASVIALASGMGIPVSTTYVSFATVIATGWGDKIYGRGNADLKIGRFIWVVFAWVAGGFVAAIGCGLVSLLVYRLEVTGIALGLAANLGMRVFFSKKANSHEAKYHPKVAKPDIPVLQDNEVETPSAP